MSINLINLFETLLQIELKWLQFQTKNLILHAAYKFQKLQPNFKSDHKIFALSHVQSSRVFKSHCIFNFTLSIPSIQS